MLSGDLLQEENHLIQQQILDEEGLTTLLCDVEVIMNDTPVTKISNDHGDLYLLTLNYLLLHRSKLFLPPGIFESNDC